VKPVSEEVEKLDSQIRGKYEETTILINKHKNEIDEFKTKINEWRDNKERQIDILEETYKNKLQLEAPETLWERRAAKYREKS